MNVGDQWRGPLSKDASPLDWTVTKVWKRKARLEATTRAFTARVTVDMARLPNEPGWKRIGAAS